MGFDSHPIRSVPILGTSAGGGPFCPNTRTDSTGKGQPPISFIGWLVSKALPVYGTGSEGGQRAGDMVILAGKEFYSRQTCGGRGQGRRFGSGPCLGHVIGPIWAMCAVRIGGSGGTQGGRQTHWNPLEIVQYFLDNGAFACIVALRIWRSGRRRDTAATEAAAATLGTHVRTACMRGAHRCPPCNGCGAFRDACPKRISQQDECARCRRRG